MADTFNPISIWGQKNNWADQIFGSLGDGASGALRLLVKQIPNDLGKALTEGMKKANFGAIFGDAFENMLLASKYQAVLNVLKQTGEVVSKSWEKADQAAYAYGKRLGLTGVQVKQLRDGILDLSNAGAQFGIRYGKSLDDVIKLQSEFSAVLGRNIRLTNQQLQDIAALSAVVGDDMAVKFSAQLENFGISTTQAGEMMTQMFNKSVKQGISLENYSKNVTDNLHLAQQYTFKRGVDGLVAMAENAAKMKLDMQQIVSLSEKVNTVESAVNVGAELQVLGGAFAQFADPLALLHDSLLDMEGLSDRLTGLVGSMGRFDKDEGRIKIDSMAQVQLRTAAQSMGMDYGKLIESATQQAKRKEVEAQMSGLSNIPDEYKELLMNTAQFQNGRAGVRGADGTFKNLASLNGNDLKALADFAKTDSENIRDIAYMLRGMTDVREGQEKEKENERATMYRQQAEHIKGIYSQLGESKDALQMLVKIELSNTIRDTMIKPVGEAGGKLLRTIAQVISKKEKGGIVYTHNSGGGVITNGEPGKEYILNSAQHGEFIVNKSSVEQYLPLLNLINGDKNGSLLNSLLNPKEFLGGNEDVIKGIIGKQAASLRKERISIVNELKNYEENSEKYNQLLEAKDKVTEKLNKKLSLLGKDSVAYTNKISKIAKGMEVGFKVGGSALAGIGALTNSIQAYKADGTMVMNHGKAVGGTIGSTAGATIGTALGAFAGPIGMMIGGAIGEFAGKKIGEAVGSGNKARRSYKYSELSRGIESIEGANTFGKLQGDFSVREMKKISAALNDGKLKEYELSDRLVEKMKQTGNSDLFVKKYERGGLLYGNSHSNGGIRINEAEGGEFIVNKLSTSKSINTLNAINNGNINDSNIKPVEPMGKQMKVRESFSQNNQQPQTMKMEPINININGTIKLDTGDKTFDISKELFNNPTLINKLTDIITKQINIDDNFAFDRKTYRRKYSSI